MKQRIVLLGPPASGKGTQAEMIKARYGIETISPGSMLRDEKRLGSALGAKAERYTSTGGLVPDELIVELVRHWLGQHGDSFVFDGFPRTVVQADALERMLLERATPLDVAFALEIGFEQIQERVLRRMICRTCGNIVSAAAQPGENVVPCPRCGGELERRADDTPEALQQRMTEYHAKSAPLVGYYSQRGLLQRIDAAKTPDEVFRKISECLEAA